MGKIFQLGGPCSLCPLLATCRHINSGGMGGRHAPNAWKILRQLENHSLHVEWIGSIDTFLGKLTMLGQLTLDGKPSTTPATS